MSERKSVFFPLALIAAGAMWLMINFGVIPAANLWALAYIWPYFLIAAGIGLILRNYWTGARIFISLLIVLGAVVAIVYAPVLGWANPPDWGWNGWNGMGGTSGSGKVINEPRQLAEFTGISIRYPAEITIKQGEPQSVTITADDNLLPQLSTEVRAGRLIVENNERNWARRVNPSQTVRITITVAELNGIAVDSAGSVHVEQLSTDELKLELNGAAEFNLAGLAVGKLTIRINGAGSITLEGNVEQIDAQLEGLGSLRGEKLYASRAEIRIDGAGSATLHVALSLKAEINGAGSINFYGSPEVEKEINGLGSVKKLGD